jgi:hypothetical protein
MSIFLLLYVFFILHLVFVIDYLLNRDSALIQNFFGTVLEVEYGYVTIDNTVIFIIICFLSLLIGIAVGGGLSNKVRVYEKSQFNSYLASTSISVYLIFFILFGLIGIVKNGFNYRLLYEYRASFNILFELRMVGHLLISNFILSGRRFTNFQVLLLFSYLLVLVVFQARSVMMEFVLILGLSLIILKRDKIKINYILIIISLSLLLPNLFVIARYWPLSLEDIVSMFFEFEYKLLFNLIILEAVDSYDGVMLLGDTFLPTLFQLLVPSFLRDAFDITIVKSNIYGSVSTDAGVLGGGFSLLGEMFINFGWYSWIYFMLNGFVLSYWRGNLVKQCTFFKGGVSFVQSGYILFLAATILAFRNDFGVYIKYILQLFVVMTMLNLIYRKRYV